MTTPVGPNTMPEGHLDLLTTTTQAITVSGDQKMSDYFNAGACRRLYVDAQGDVYVKRLHDSGFQKYTAVPAGTYIDGWIIAVGGSTTATIIAEL